MAARAVAEMAAVMVAPAVRALGSRAAPTATMEATEVANRVAEAVEAASVVAEAEVDGSEVTLAAVRAAATLAAECAT